jgi:hypothetical protein
MTVHLSKIRIAAIAAVLAAAAVSSAESTSNFGFKLGLIFPADSAVKDNAGKTGLDIGVAYFLKSKPLIKGQTLPSVELDYLRIGGNDNKFEGIHLGYAERVFLGKEDEKSGPYAGFAAGVAFNKVSGTTTTGGGQSGGSVTTKSSEDKTQFFGELLAGYRIEQNFGVEAFVRFSPKFNDINPTVYGVRATYRF